MISSLLIAIYALWNGELPVLFGIEQLSGPFSERLGLDAAITASVPWAVVNVLEMLTGYWLWKSRKNGRKLGLVLFPAGMIFWIGSLWIIPIWFILPLGLVVAGAGGLAAGWAYAELRRGLPQRPWTALSVVGLIAVILLPAVALAELRAPLFAVTPAGAMPAVATWVIVARFVGELLVTATIVGGLVGGWLGRTRHSDNRDRHRSDRHALHQPTNEGYNEALQHK